MFNELYNNEPTKCLTGNEPRTNDYQLGFSRGAQWKEQQMLNNVTTWLKYNVNKFAYISTHNSKAKVNENYLVEELLKAMEEE